MTPEQIADFVIDAHVCRSCGKVFDRVKELHSDEDCAKGYADWDSPSRQQIAEELRVRLIDAMETD